MRSYQIKKPSKFKKLFKPDKSLAKPDYFILILVGLIVVFGLAMLSSASSVLSFKRFDSTYHLFFRQLLRGFLPGLILFFILAKLNYQRWEKYSIAFFIISVILLLAVFIPGIGADFGRAQSWISIGGIPFQPSEVIKLFLIFSLAGWFAYRGPDKTKDFWNGLVPFVVILSLISIPILLQPDLGTLMVVVMIALSIYFTAGARLSHLFGLILAGLGSIGILIAIAPYRAARLTTFLNPEIDPSGIGYHINQAFLAIGSGGLFGLGFGQSRQKFAYLPEVMGDSIFAIIAEELGFILTVGLIIAFLALAWRGLRLAQRVEDDYARLVVIGIISWFVIQAFFNIAAMLGLMPLTGIPLPFISYGGTALATSLAAAGVLINISRHVDLR